MVLLLSDIPEYPTQISVAELIARRRGKDPSFNVGRRTVERDLRHLAERFPIQFEATSKPGGWSFRKGERLVFPLMGDAEAMTLVLAEQMISGLLPPSVVNEIRPLVRQAQMKVHFGGKRQLAAWPRKVRIVRNIPKRIGADIDADLMNVLYGAVFAEQQLEVRYLKLGAKEPSSYLLNPLGLVLREPVIYLVCTRADDPKLLHWPLHRFVSARRVAVRLEDLPV
ncbi:MAG: helix-turn-helix transcriptional regulator [Panacagrimonas sp.]